MKQHIQSWLAQAVQAIAPEHDIEVMVSAGKSSEHGEYSSNAALLLSKKMGQPPRVIAQAIVDKLTPHASVARVEIAGPGFINFFLASEAFWQAIRQLWQQPKAFCQATIGQNQRIHLEYVSVNPTGPLHVGHGRNAVFGSALSNILQAAGFEVWQEYYVNDAGRQMQILALSVWLRYLQACGDQIALPANAYQGDYINDIAQNLLKEHGRSLYAAFEPPSQQDDIEAAMDGMIKNACQKIGEAAFLQIIDVALDYICLDIKDDLQKLGIKQHWFSERSLVDGGAVQKALDTLQAKDALYTSDDGAIWFKASAYGDDKDRVLVRTNGQYTYFAVDLAYHHHKMQLGFDKVLDVFGSDHHGYVARIEAGLKAMGLDASSYRAFLVQFATLFRGDKRLQMSTRSGSFVTLRQLIEEIGVDATRFFYVMRKCEQHMEFDIELAKRHSKDNPVYYIQYAHARIHSVLREATSQKLLMTALDDVDLALLDSCYENDLMRLLMRYPEYIETSAAQFEPHQIAWYLRELANLFHTYYNAQVFVSADSALTQARLALIKSVQVVLAHGLGLLGVQAPERM